MQMKRHANSGFTLLEVLISMVIFSFMSVMAYGGLVKVFKSDEVISSLEIKLKTLKRTMMFFERDMRQLVPRPQHYGYGSSEFKPALSAALGSDSENIVEFTCAGVSNPLDLTRSSLQRVRYVLVDKKLSRWSWKLFDRRLEDFEPTKMQLLDNVESFKLRFWAKNGAWKEVWSSNERPLAVELTLEHKHWGKIKRIIAIN